jgi:short-subunit dehydrogenase
MSLGGRQADPLAGKRVLVTGGSSGIGLACAQELTRRGARVALLARGEKALEEAATSLDAGATVLAADITDVDALRHALDEAAEALGGVDAVVANAAAATYGPFVDMTPDDYRRTIDVALLGTINTAHAALPHLHDTGGTLVVVGSISGRLPIPWLAAYTAAKHGVRGFVRALQVELRALKSPVKVALVAPGPVDTPFWWRARSTDGRPMPRAIGAYPPEDVAREVARALGSPRTERTVGGSMAAWALLDALAPNVMVAALGRVAKLGWLHRERQPQIDADSLTESPAHARRLGGMVRRRSVLVRLRDLAQAGARSWRARQADLRDGEGSDEPRPDRPAADPRSRTALDALHARAFNYDASHPDRLTAAAGWRHETRCQELPAEAPGPPEPGGSWEIARDLMRDYEFADPKMVSAVFHPDSPLEGRDMPLFVPAPPRRGARRRRARREPDRRRSRGAGVGLELPHPAGPLRDGADELRGLEVARHRARRVPRARRVATRRHAQPVSHRRLPRVRTTRARALLRVGVRADGDAHHLAARRPPRGSRPERGGAHRRTARLGGPAPHVVAGAQLSICLTRRASGSAEPTPRPVRPQALVARRNSRDASSCRLPRATRVRSTCELRRR